MNDVKFKIGDKVVFCKSTLDSGMIDAKEGDVFTVSEFSEEHWGDVVRLQGVRGVISASHLEHYVEKEKEVEKKFAKVGDKIRIVAAEFTAGHYKNGDVLEVAAVYHHSGVEVLVAGDEHLHVYHKEYEIVEDEFVFTEEQNTEQKIKWEIGQVVWDVRYGEGVVGTLATLEDYPVGVKFQGGMYASYTKDGKNRYGDKYRSLFFSEPKIEAELFPPKKKFVPTFKKGETVVAKKKDGKNTVVFYVDKETELSVESTGCGYPKALYNFYKIGEEVKWD